MHIITCTPCTFVHPRPAASVLWYMQCTPYTLVFCAILLLRNMWLYVYIHLGIHIHTYVYIHTDAYSHNTCKLQLLLMYVMSCTSRILVYAILYYTILDYTILYYTIRSYNILYFDILYLSSALPRDSASDNAQLRLRLTAPGPDLWIGTSGVPRANSRRPPDGVGTSGFYHIMLRLSLIYMCMYIYIYIYIERER